jgi:hypothetical protein
MHRNHDVGRMVNVQPCLAQRKRPWQAVAREQDTDAGFLLQRGHGFLDDFFWRPMT